MLTFCFVDSGVILADDTHVPGTIGNGGAMLMGFLGVSPFQISAPHNGLNSVPAISHAEWLPLIFTPELLKSW